MKALGIFLILFSVIISCITLHEAQLMTYEWVEGALQNTTCGPDKNIIFSRRDAFVCLATVMDTNNDYYITPDEIEYAKGHFLTWWERFFSWFADVGMNQIMRDCGGENDGRISFEDFKKFYKTCIPVYEVGSTTEISKTLCTVKELICDRAALETGKLTY